MQDFRVIIIYDHYDKLSSIIMSIYGMFYNAY